MSIKKILLLASMALAALAFAIPATAMAEEFEEEHWTMGESIEEAEQTVNLTGNLRASTALGSGINCTIHTKVTLNAERLAHVNITKKTCTGFGTFNGCTVEQVTNTNEGETLTFEYHLAKTKKTGTIHIIVTSVEVTYDMNANCDNKNIKTPVIYKTPRLILTPNNPKAISSVSESAEEDTAEFNGLEFPVETSGELEVEGEANGTYGIG